MVSEASGVGEWDQERERLRYREHLVAADRKSVELFDNAVIALSGGALGISVVILERISDRLERAHAVIELGWLMPVAWACWGVSVASCLLSHYLSHISLRRAIAQHDLRKASGRPGGWWAFATDVSTALAGVLFLGGLLAAGWFLRVNIKGV